METQLTHTSDYKMFHYNSTDDAVMAVLRRESNFQCAAICFTTLFYNLGLGCTTDLRGLCDAHNRIAKQENI